jgi:hypothetical protein
MKISSKLTVVVFLLASLAAVAQAAPATKSEAPGPAKLPKQTPPQQPKKLDRAAAYYHYSLAHRFEHLAAIYGSSDYANKAIREYQLAIENDPSSDYLKARLRLVEQFVKTGRTSDAMLLEHR